MDVVDHVAGAGAFDSTVGRAGLLVLELSARCVAAVDFCFSYAGKQGASSHEKNSNRIHGLPISVAVCRCVKT